MLKLTLLSPERRLLEGESVEELTIRGSEGEIQIFPGHAPMIGTLELGIFNFKTVAGHVTRGVISSGFFEIHDDHLTVVAETLELQGEVDLERAKKAQKEAEQLLSEADLDEHKFRNYQLSLEKALVRQQLSSKDMG